VLTLVALAGTACSSSGSDAKSSSGFDPEEAAAMIRDLGAVQTEGEGSYGKTSGPVAGTIGYDPYRYRIRVSISTGQQLAQATVLRVDDRVWVRRTAISTLDRAVPLGVGTLMFRGASTPPYVELKAPAKSFSAYLSVPFDPAALLDRVAATGAEFAAAGASEVDGTSRERFTTELSVRDARLTGIRGLTVWVDDDGLPVQVAFPTAAQGNVRYTVAPFDGEVRVAAPPAAEVEETGQPLPDAVAPYTEVLTTTAGDIPIRVLTAPGDRGWTCWKVESDPPFEGLADTRPSGGTCAVPVDPNDLPEDQYAIPLGTTADVPYVLLGLVVPPGSNVEFRRFGAPPVTVPAGPTGLALYAGPPDQPLGLAIVRGPQATLVCGPVGIDNATDFDAAEQEGGTHAELRGSPWNCLAEDLANALSE
jgi:hypothetical protein